MYNKISGEYWINNYGGIQYADGNIGDMNHEMIAYQHIIEKFIGELVSFANELGISTEGIDEYEAVNDPSIISKLLDEITEKLKANNEPDIDKYIMRQISAHRDAYKILKERGDPTLYMMQYEGWIAVRSMNIELYGYNEKKRQSLARGIGEIMDDEGIEQLSEDFNFYDLKTHKQTYLSLEDIEQPQIMMRPTNNISSVGHTKFNDPSDEIENLKNKNKSLPNKWNQQAQKVKMVGPGQQLWRGTSESFKEWLNYEENGKQ